MEFWARLSAFINNNPVQERDLFFMAMLKPLGIEKGKPFKPDARQRAILEDAARIGDAMGRAMLFEGTNVFSKPDPFRGTNWHWVVPAESDQQTDTYGQVDERLHYTYGAIYTSPPSAHEGRARMRTTSRRLRTKTAIASTAASPTVCTYPPNAPAASFWSLTLYDTATRSMLENPSNDAARSSYDKLKTNADGSIDLYFGPKAPAGIGEQLDRDGSRQRLLPDVSLLHAQSQGCSTGRGSCRTSS